MSITNADDQIEQLEAEIESNRAAIVELVNVLKAAVDCGMVPVSSAQDGGSVSYSIQVQVADMIRAAIAKHDKSTTKETA